MSLLSAIERDGYAVVKCVADSGSLHSLQALTEVFPTESGSRRGGIRQPFETINGLADALSTTRVHEIAADLLGDHPAIVRAILFDKTPASNWSVTWHRDESIAVNQRVDLAGFGPWSVKAGINHVRPPQSVLENMITIRLHLDDTPLNNGPLRVVPGSHRAENDPADPDRHAIVVTLDAGDALLMRPRLYHASSKQSEGNRRRVLHLECASGDLPGELTWHDRWSFTPR